jgi:hypothetical protein
MSDAEERVILNGLPHNRDKEQAFAVPILNISSELRESYWSRDSSIGIATGYGLGGPGSIPSSERFLSSSQHPDRHWGFTQPLVQWVLGTVSPGVKRQGHEADYSPASSAEVKKGGAIIPLPHTSSWHSA